MCTDLMNLFFNTDSRKPSLAVLLGPIGQSLQAHCLSVLEELNANTTWIKIKKCLLFPDIDGVLQSTLKIHIFIRLLKSKIFITITISVPSFLRTIFHFNNTIFLKALLWKL